MPKIVVIGGGWAGVAAAVAAAKLGAEVELAERTDLLLGSGLAGGVMRSNGRWTAAEELIAMGGGDVVKLSDQVCRHRDIEFPGHKHASLYDVTRIEPAVRRLLEDYDVKVHFGVRGRDVELAGDRITRVYLDDGDALQGDAFVDATGTAGGEVNCAKHGNGCVQCIYRCPAFGDRISIVARAGVREKAVRRAGGAGLFSGSCMLHKDSLAPDIADKLNTAGVAIVPIPPHLRPSRPWAQISCRHHARRQFAENLIVLDTGHAKLMSPFFPVDTLRQIPGFEEAVYCDPCAGGRGNSVRFLALAPRQNTMKVAGVANLFCGGEKAGPLAGHTEAIVTGTLAGHNAVRHALGRELLEFLRQLACGEAIAWVGEQAEGEAGIQKKYSFAGAVLFSHLQQEGLYTTDRGEVRRRVRAAGMENILAQKP